MRVLHEDTYQHIRITYMTSNGKMIIKFEDDALQEQIYKFREGGVVSDLASARKLITPEYLAGVITIFGSMKQHQDAMVKKSVVEKPQFPTIL